MRKFLTVVIEYKDGEQQPAFHADMECLGGKIISVMFDDGLERLEEAEELISELQELQAN